MKNKWATKKLPRPKMKKGIWLFKGLETSISKRSPNQEKRKAPAIDLIKGLDGC